jgi:hypothetical protein
MDLARRRARELCRRAKSEPRRYLVACPPLTAEAEDCRGIGCRPALQLDCRGDDFRNAYDMGLHDLGILQQDLPDLERCDVDAAGFDHLLQPATKSVPPVLLGRGTDGSNPFPSSGESVSPVGNGAAREKSRAFAAPYPWVET